MGYVYLIGESETPNRYKIGSTKHKNINKRLKQLQTGNSEELFIKEYFETEYPFKLEKMLHNRFKNNNLIGEWFDLSNGDIESFMDVCKQYNDTLNILKDNPFLFKKKVMI